MTFKPGDLVIMNARGIRYHNPDRFFEAYNVLGVVLPRNFEWALCELMAIQGVGEVLSFDPEYNAVEVRFKNSVNGVYYFNTMFYEASHVSKLSFFQKLKYKLLGRV